VSSAAQLDPALNRAPEVLRHIHVMGICGTGMAALAGMLKECGYCVTGSDQNVYPPMSDFLAASGIPVMGGYRAENLDPRPDLVIVGNVIRAVNPEACRLAELGIPYLSMPQALSRFFIQGHGSLVVAGTHGKTTTASLLATALDAIGAGPGFMIGGIVEAFGRNYATGSGQYFVVEGDEYDTAFFDKSSKFVHYRPDYAIITSIEFDHADIFSDLDMIKRTFSRIVDLIPPGGMIIACHDDPVVREIVSAASCRVMTYGLDAGSEWQLADFTPQGLTAAFTVYCRGEFFGSFTLPMPGLHNGLNATAVIALMDSLGFDPDAITRGIASFGGVKRRQQVRGEVNSITVIDDFAHHPTAVRETVHALKMAWPQRRLVAVFEPRTNSSRRAVFQARYADAFAHADVVVVREHVPLDNVPADQQFSSARLVEDLAAAGKKAYYFADTDRILSFLGDFARPGDVVAILSNGGFDNIHQRLLDILAADVIQ
jgi:UDP-N-acetylmuramate: L-alanyl-gamma-D-glutamyl-meso-diaminopimelate ligase